MKIDGWIRLSNPAQHNSWSGQEKPETKIKETPENKSAVESVRLIFCAARDVSGHPHKVTACSPNEGVAAVL